MGKPRARKPGNTARIDAWRVDASGEVRGHEEKAQGQRPPEWTVKVENKQTLFSRGGKMNRQDQQDQHDKQA